MLRTGIIHKVHVANPRRAANRLNRLSSALSAGPCEYRGPGITKPARGLLDIVWTPI